jgi:hypothetical protein
LVYKNVKVIKIKHGHSLQGFSDNQDGFEIDDDEYETEMVSDDEEGTMDYTDGVSECSTQCEHEETDSELDGGKLSIKNTVDRSLPNDLKLETDFIED